jgi:hypothetical protein
MTMRQNDLFSAAKGSVAPGVADTPQPDTVRVRLHALLRMVRDASEMPWEPSRARVQEYLFTNMASWLPQDERDTLRKAFASEMSRLRRGTGG